MITRNRDSGGLTIRISPNCIALFLWVSGYTQWQNLNFPGRVEIRTLLPKGSELYAATSGLGVYHSPDNGNNWLPLDSGLTDQYVYSLTTIGSKLVAGTSTGIFVTSDQGATWVGMNAGLPVNTQVTCLATAGANVFAGSYSSGIYRSTNLASAWERMDSASGISSVNAFLITGANLFAAAANGIYRSTDSGQHWTPINQGLRSTYVMSLAAIGSRLFAGADSVYQSTDNGDNWIKVTGMPAFNGGIPSLLAIGNNLVAGTDNGAYLSTNYGVNWSEIDAGFTTNNFIESLATNGTILYCTVSNSTLDSGIWKMNLAGVGILGPQAQATRILKNRRNRVAPSYSLLGESLPGLERETLLNATRD